MKALAAEMVRNFGGRLQSLGISVKELTGDMSLTKQEILKTQVSLFLLSVAYRLNGLTICAQICRSYLLKCKTTPSFNCCI